MLRRLLHRVLIGDDEQIYCGIRVTNVFLFQNCIVDITLGLLHLFNHTLGLGRLEPKLRAAECLGGVEQLLFLTRCVVQVLSIPESVRARFHWRFAFREAGGVQDRGLGDFLVYLDKIFAVGNLA